MSEIESTAGRTGRRDPYRELFERSADAILIIEGETFIDCNAATVEMLGARTKEQVLQSHPSELSPPRQPDGRDSFEKANEMIALAFERGSHRFEWDHKRVNGEVFPVEVLLTAVEEPGRRTLHVVWRDITERKLLEEELRQALKMEAIGKLTGGIAHDFNNLLVSVIGHADLLSHQLAADSAAKEHVQAIRRAGERAAELVQQLLAFGRKQQLLPVVLDLNALVGGVWGLMSRLVGESTAMVDRRSSEPLWIKADRSQIEQVLMNLAANARDAMPDGGHLTVETRSVDRPSSGRDGGDAVAPGPHALLSVQDTGSGMDHDTQLRAFDPFFTTKEAGKGSGLGLATVHGIVRQSQGSVTLHSTPGQGTQVDVLLPLTDEAAPSAPEPRPTPERGPGGTETILVVEDEPAVAELARSALESSGYRVLACGDGREALATYQEQAGNIDLILTDVIMPVMGGARLVTELHASGHRPRVLFMSGYTNEELTSLHRSEFQVRVLEKPFEISDLLTSIRGLLDQ